MPDNSRPLGTRIISSKSSAQVFRCDCPYAGRRNAAARLKDFIDTKTMIALEQAGVNQDD